MDLFLLYSIDTNTSTNCDPGCSTVTACETAAKCPWFYSCNTTVDPVTNDTIAEHEVPELVRLLAAHAIALQGFSVNSTLSNSDLQYQVYPSQSPFGTSLQGMVQAMELTMSRFAAGVIAMVAIVNSDIVVDRLPPTKGSSLNVDHRDYVWFVLLPLSHFSFCLVLLLLSWLQRWSFLRKEPRPWQRCCMLWRLARVLAGLSGSIEAG